MLARVCTAEAFATSIRRISPQWASILGFALCLVAATANAADSANFSQALESITSTDLKRHVFYLADDTFEGREAGSRGGRVAGGYLAREFQKAGLSGGGVKEAYFQDFDGNSRNILGIWEGSDPLLKHEVVVLGAHYDHVGYGTESNSFGPIGRIHNGADDNASGTSGLLEIVEAMVRLEPRPRRTILFALWDGEEKGLLGSKHWVAHPTIPLDRVRLMLNMDMIGRLRDNKIEFGGSRTAQGLRTLVSRQNDGIDLLLDFTWEMKDNSDHHPFFAQRIPVLFAFTGLHDDYHRPSDDAEKIDTAGMQRVTQLMFRLLYDVAQQPALPPFRPASQKETPELQKQFERPLPPLAGRLGINWNLLETDGRGVRVSRVVPGSPADAAGVRAHDRIVRFAGRTISDGELFRSLVLTAESPVPMIIERDDAAEPIELSIGLTGKPVRLGLSWRADDCEPGTLVITRVVPGSPAERAGLKVLDRVLQIEGQTFRDGDEFQELATSLASPISLTRERMGQIRSVKIVIPAEAGIQTAGRSGPSVNAR
jgi:hypothetical protein